MEQELRAKVSGKVQGVGFRWTVVEIAEQLKLKGTVKNLRDGTVEIRAVGEKTLLEQFVKLIREQKSSAIIKDISVEYCNPSNYSGFRIEH